ncbi:MAG TPA: flagellar regulator YcgR PilZN domain-containing protein [Rubrivivax sp.]
MTVTFLDTRPAGVDPERAVDTWGPFRVDDASERDRLLRQLRDGSVPVNLISPAGCTLRSAIWSFDAAQRKLVFSASESDPQLQPLIESDEAIAVAYLASVKLQFDVSELVLVRSAQACALQARLPRELYRFQRRTGYRVRTPERSAPLAELRHPSMPEMTLVLRVIDVGIGGCALLLPADVPALQVGLLLQGVQIELDAETRFVAALRLQHMSTQGRPKGEFRSAQHEGASVTLLQPAGTRIGCEWHKIEGNAQRALQRYIDLTQKRRRLMSPD